MAGIQLFWFVFWISLKLICSGCPSRSVCVSKEICSSGNIGQRCGEDFICCDKFKILDSEIYGKDQQDASSYSRGDKHYQEPEDSYGNKDINISRRRNILSNEARSILRAYTYRGECGVRRLQHAKISTGYTVDSGITSYAEFPWQVVILMRLNKVEDSSGYRDAYKYHCGGVVVDKDVVVTAAHCVYGVRLENLKLRFGEYNLQGTRGEIFPVIERRVDRKIIHDNYNPNKLVHDLAILILDRPIDFRRTPHISPVCLPPRDLQFDKYTKCFITGYGEDVFKPNYGSNILKSASVTLHEENSCKELLFQSIKKLSSNFFHSSQSCFTGGSGRDACTGDGGGPVVCPISNSKVSVCSGGYGCESEHYFLAGIISWGSEECGKEDSVTVISDMVSHRDWLLNELDRHQGYSNRKGGDSDRHRYQSNSHSDTHRGDSDGQKYQSNSRSDIYRGDSDRQRYQYNSHSDAHRGDSDRQKYQSNSHSDIHRGGSDGQRYQSNSHSDTHSGGSDGQRYQSNSRSDTHSGGSDGQRYQSNSLSDTHRGDSDRQRYQSNSHSDTHKVGYSRDNKH